MSDPITITRSVHRPFIPLSDHCAACASKINYAETCDQLELIIGPSQVAFLVHICIACSQTQLRPTLSNRIVAAARSAAQPAAYQLAIRAAMAGENS